MHTGQSNVWRSFLVGINGNTNINFFATLTVPLISRRLRPVVIPNGNQLAAR